MFCLTHVITTSLPVPFQKAISTVVREICSRFLFIYNENRTIVTLYELNARPDDLDHAQVTIRSIRRVHDRTWHRKCNARLETVQWLAWNKT